MQLSDLSEEFPASTNRLYERLGQIRTNGTAVVDLMRGNVGDVGIVFPPEEFEGILVDAAWQARGYRPDSLGQPIARDAIAAYYRPLALDPGHILLTPGTSVSYWYAFKVLCNPSDEVLCPTPSYPLFDYIARLADVETRPYRLSEDRGWRIDFDHLESQITERTRAIILISPHNPTGMVADAGEIDRLADVARRHELAIVADEVFIEFSYGDRMPARPAASDAPLVLTLNGFSKMFALPGMKIGWVAITGDDALVRGTVRTLELISDTFLPVNEVAQFSVPAIFEKGGAFLGGYRQRVGACRSAAIDALGSHLKHPPAGGFYLVVPYTRNVEEEKLAMELLEEERALVHPGYFYDIEGRHLVMTFIQPPDTLKEVLARLVQRL